MALARGEDHAAPEPRESRYANPYPVPVHGAAGALHLYREHLAAHPSSSRPPGSTCGARPCVLVSAPGEADACHAAVLLAAWSGRKNLATSRAWNWPHMGSSSGYRTCSVLASALTPPPGRSENSRPQWPGPARHAGGGHLVRPLARCQSFRCSVPDRPGTGDRASSPATRLLTTAQAVQPTMVASGSQLSGWLFCTGVAVSVTLSGPGPS
jgi:hypothetical protein